MTMAEIAIYNFSIYQGNDDIYVLKIEDIDEEGNSVNANLQNYNFLLTIKDNPISDKIEALTTENNYIRLGIINSNGIFQSSETNPYAIKIHFPHELTEKLYAPKYAYDLFGVKEGNIREVLLKGDINVTRSISYGKSNARHY